MTKKKSFFIYFTFIKKYCGELNLSIFCEIEFEVNKKYPDLRENFSDENWNSL